MRVYKTASSRARAWVKSEDRSWFTSPNGERWYYCSAQSESEAKEHAELLWGAGDGSEWVRV